MSNNIASPFASPSSSLSLPDLIAYYETCNRAEGKSPKTIKWYSDNLKRFHNYLKSRHLPDSLDRIDIRLLRCLSNAGSLVIPLRPYKQIHFPPLLSTATSEPFALSSPGSLEKDWLKSTLPGT
jgi:hypothetical protein